MVSWKMIQMWMRKLDLLIKMCFWSAFPSSVALQRRVQKLLYFGCNLQSKGNTLDKYFVYLQVVVTPTDKCFYGLRFFFRAQKRGWKDLTQIQSNPIPFSAVSWKDEIVFLLSSQSLAFYECLKIQKMFFVEMFCSFVSFAPWIV